MAEIVLAMLIALGLSGVLWLIRCRLMFPVFGDGLWTVVQARGAGEGLEQQLRGIVWLHSCGLLRGRVVVADMGLDERGRALADQLVVRWPQVTLCDSANLAAQIEM